MKPLLPYSFNLTWLLNNSNTKVIPSKAPCSTAEYFSELVKSVGSLSDLSHMPNLNMQSYNVNIPKDNSEIYSTGDETAFSSAFMIGCDFEVYANADKDAIFSGYNTNTDDIYWQLTFDGTTATSVVRFDFFAMYDSLLICENGTCYAKY